MVILFKDSAEKFALPVLHTTKQGLVPKVNVLRFQILSFQGAINIEYYRTSAFYHDSYK